VDDFQVGRDVGRGRIENFGHIKTV
jgi:hypothetical protein